jgi:glyoxylase-like metal-dependent hydrolase (beta-lactamase superfamily II)/8-oxo-dGTP pyrophosphatase MutT (NUDIX family)
VNQKPANPKDASAVILIKDGKVLWAQRNPKIKFLGGWHAFPGGKLETTDCDIEVKNCADPDLEKFIVCAVRELFEETGVLLVRNGEKLTKGQRASLHDDLISGRSGFAEILSDWNLLIDAEDFFYTGFWTTPKFSPVRFKTRFFVAECPFKQEPYAAITELLAPEFTTPEKALERWSKSEVLISPPVLIALQELADSRFGVQDSRFKIQDLKGVLTIRNLLEKSQKVDGNIDYIELNPHIICYPLKTETFPPATHTNCFIVGREKFVVIDAASRDVGEQHKLFELVDSFIKKNFVCREIIVSHSHPDHFGGETALQKHLFDKFNLRIPISAHKITAESLRGKVEFQKFIADQEIINLADENGASFELQAFHAPGHARGHLCFYDEAKGFLLASDNVVGTGTVVIAPPEGDMTDYLESLRQMKNLPNLRFLCGSHGSAIFDAKGKIEEYVAHRLEREKQILEAVQNGAKTMAEIVERVYIGLKPELVNLAEKSVEAHLEKLKIDGQI